MSNVSDLNRVIVGNVIINPGILRQFLKKSHYFMTYKPEDETIRLSVNDGSGGRDIMFIHNTSYENAAKLAEGLGLKGDGSTSLMWSKWNPIYSLHDDGSAEAERLRIEMLKLGLPFRLHGAHIKTYNEEPMRTWAWCDQGLHSPPMWKVEVILDKIREAAQRYKEQLETTP